MNNQTAQNLLVNRTTKMNEAEKSIGEFSCFNNNKINLLGTIQVDITSGSSMRKLHNTTGRYQFHKHHWKGRHGQTRTTSNKVAPTKTR